MKSHRIRSGALLAAITAALLLPSAARAQSPDTSHEAPTPSTPSTHRQSRDDAWWTGPMLAPSAATLPRGHFLIEPYVYDVSANHSHGFGSLTYINYGLVDRLTVGIKPTFGWKSVRDGVSSSGIGLGDLTAQAQFGITQFDEARHIPAVAFAVHEVFPTGDFDQLRNRPSDGLGGGSYATTLALYSQYYFWLPNGRILRTRFNLEQTFSRATRVRDVSVFGTGEGFRGRAKPGASFFGDLSSEYSITRNWVFALDVVYRHGWSTSVSGYDSLDPDGDPDRPSIQFSSGTSDSFAFAPGIEYNWKPTMGILFATRIIPASHNTTSSLTPAIAVNMVY